MRAVVFTQYGSPDELELRDLPMPEPRSDEVLVRVHAASINEWDWSALHGRPWINRLIFGLLDCLAGIFLTGPWRSRASRKHLRLLALRANEGLGDLCAMAGSGVLKPLIDRIFPIEETAAAFRHYGTAPFVGKIVISMA